MTDNRLLSEIKDHITATIRRNSDRGFIPYSGCNRICTDDCCGQGYCRKGLPTSRKTM
ncbi:hypothetical protein SOV_33380 [Sporomusa ovata DSM 2662]|nr:hypothetical protein SOV_5c04410 [Sporomusa ovata DSM 2662]